jgi:hypothetical protein
MAARNAGVPAERRIDFRIGINLGDIIIDENDIFGDGVNIAARLEALAEPGGICVSRVVRDQVRDKLAIPFEDMGEQLVKNIARPVRAYRALLAERADRPSVLPETAPPRALPDRPSIAVLPFHNVSGDAEQEYFVDGITEDIITALSVGRADHRGPAANRQRSRRGLPCARVSHARPSDRCCAKKCVNWPPVAPCGSCWCCCRHSWDTASFKPSPFMPRQAGRRSRSRSLRVSFRRSTASWSRHWAGFI